MVWDVLIGGGFLCLLFWFGLQRAVSEGDYLLAGRQTGLISLTATLVMTEFNTATLIAFSSLGYLLGGSALLLPLIFLIGLLFYAFAVAKKWKQFDGLSVAGFFSQRYGKDVGMIASVFLLLSMAGFSAAYLKSLYLLFSPFLPAVSQWALSGCLVTFVALLMVRGGLISIIKADVFSFGIVVLFFPLFALFCSRGEVAEEVTFSMGLPLPYLLSLIFLTMFTYILAPWYGQKIFAARSEKVAFVSVALSAVIVFLLYSLAISATYLFRKNGGTAPSAEQALPFAIMQKLPPGLKGLGFALLCAASATTLTGVWSAMSAMVVGDFGKFQEEGGIWRSLLLTLGFAALSFLLANLLVDRVFEKLILANIPVAALSFALLGGFYWKRANRLGAYASIVVGLVAGLGAYLVFGEARHYTYYWAFCGIPAGIIAGVVFSLIKINNVEIIDF